MSRVMQLVIGGIWVSNQICLLPQTITVSISIKFKLGDYSLGPVIITLSDIRQVFNKCFSLQ